ncbi:MAG: hypothetical protein HY254_19625 [Burkholderiales bacterium]|nr:hypothetical protein [Burkholderiales bacterium]
MNSFNNKLIAILLALVLPLSASFAHAAGRSSGSSGGFRGGFSSQRSVSKPAPSKPSNTGFGSFNNSNPANASKKSDSALNRDLEKNQAQANAQKSMDARQQTSQQMSQPTPVSGFGNSNSSSNSIGNNMQAANKPVYAAPPVMQSAPIPMQSPVATQRSSGILPAVVGGVILGSVMSHSQAAENRSVQQLEPIANVGTGNGKDELGGTAAVTLDDKPTAAASPETPATAKVAEEAHGSKILATLIWSLLLGGLGWAGWKILSYRRKQASKQDSAVNYSLGGN